LFLDLEKFKLPYHQIWSHFFYTTQSLKGIQVAKI